MALLVLVGKELLSEDEKIQDNQAIAEKLSSRQYDTD
jgi:hypothetical protein